MRERDASDVFWSLVAVVMDGLTLFGAFLLATWLRFNTSLVPLRNAPGKGFYGDYLFFSAVATLAGLLVLRNQGLFVRPQTGTFVNKVPRLIKSSAVTLLLSVVLAFGLQNEINVSRGVILWAAAIVPGLLLLQRLLLFRIEWNLARHSRERNRVLIIGTGSVAVRLKRTFRKEHMLRARVVGLLRSDADEALDPEIPPSEVIGTAADLERVLEQEHVDQVILTTSGLGTEQMLDLMLQCERNLVTFNMVPDLFHLMTTSMDVQSLDDIPLLGISAWPLDFFWNRMFKRIEDLLGGAVGLILSAPIIAAAAAVIRATSPGPVFYRQERCGENGRTFNLYKLRTMQVDAEKDTGPVFTSVEDGRRTRVGAFLRRHNLDELPQFWNVLKGEMSLVGPRPERPHFVEQFKTGVARYMWRHVSKPGLTGWAQINGLRGDTSISERVKYDLYYLENWSLSFDFKILVKTLFARENAY